MPSSPFRGRAPSSVAYSTCWGRMYEGISESILERPEFDRLAGRFQMVLTSPPFPLNHKKRYGNLRGSEYVEWLASFGPTWRRMLTPDGSIVVEMGNSWQKDLPVFSNLALRALLELQERSGLYLCQEFIWSNPAKLPTPAQWVNVERIRVKDSFTRLWWMSPVPKPKADNRRVLQAYSGSMQDLLKARRYNSGRRPSDHVIGTDSFLKDHGGAIPGSVITVANTSSQDAYMLFCRERSLRPHPARMPRDLVRFFVKFLTDPGDMILDPFAGSNTTGAVAEELGRYWISIEPVPEYIEGSRGRFPTGCVRERTI
jgi:DNA modification methylase